MSGYEIMKSQFYKTFRTNFSWRRNLIGNNTKIKAPS